MTFQLETAFRYARGGGDGMIDLPALLLTVDAIRGAIVAVLCGDLDLASRQLAEARKAAEHAYPLDSRESYGLELVLESITEAAAS